MVAHRDVPTGPSQTDGRGGTKLFGWLLCGESHHLSPTESELTSKFERSPRKPSRAHQVEAAETLLNTQSRFV